MKTSLAIRLRRLAWLPLRVTANLDLRRWHRRVEQAREVQARLLERILENLAETDFARQFGLARLRTIQDLRKALPVAGYERAAPFIERVKQGDRGALLAPGARLHMFAMTSGTTGTPKFIPITDAVYNAYRLSWHVWGVHALADHFDAFGARLLQISSRPDEQITPSGVPAGAMSGFTAYSQSRMIRRAYVSPPEVSAAADTAAKYYLACRLGLQVPRVMPMTANPSTLLGLAQAMNERQEELLRDLADGTLSAHVALDGTSRRRIESCLRPMPRRARELGAQARRLGRLYPRDVWQLPLIATWKGGTLGLYLRELPHYWGDAPVRDIGLIASEGRFTVPIHDEGSGGLLEVTGNFYEFVPEDQIDQPDPPAILPHETEAGRCYYIVPTTPSGLVRYHIGDVVRVVGHDGCTPILEFLNKGEHVSSLTGEKLTEHQVTLASEAALESLNLFLGNYCLAPAWGAVPGYTLLVEEGAVTPARATALAAAVDKELARLNIEYQGKRASGRLAPVSVKTIPDGAWQTFDAQAVAARGGRIEQYKHKFLVNKVDFERRFEVRATYGPPAGAPAGKERP
jgi:hypothetical protein